jgi:hypothetical protein
MASLGNWPASIVPASCLLRMNVNQRSNAAPGGGSEQVVDMLNDRWIMELTLPAETFAEAAAVEAFLNSFRGMVNTVNAWPFHRAEPRGTLSGTITTSGATSAGASSIVLTGGTNGQTLLAGDFFVADGQLFQAAADATVATGLIEVDIVNRVRNAIADGASVTLTNPSIAWRKLSDSGILYAQGLTDEISVTLGEAIS